MKKQVLEYFNKHNIEIEISYEYMDRRKIEGVDFYTPDGYQFSEELHGRCYPDWWLEDGNASEQWKFIYNDMCFNPPIKCPADCVCKEMDDDAYEKSREIAERDEQQYSKDCTPPKLWFEKEVA